MVGFVLKWAGTASVNFALATLLQVIILLSTGGNNGGGYRASKYVVMFFHGGFLLIQAILNSMSISWVSLLAQFSAIWNILGD